MALTSEISSLTERYLMPKLVDNIFNSNSLLQRWRKNNVEKMDGGTSIDFPVAYATTTAAGWFTGADTLDTAANDQITQGTLSLCQAYANITVTRLDELKNSGKAAIINLVKSKVQLAEKTLADTLGTGLFNAGTTTNALIGLRLVCAGTGSTYAGISKTTYSWWRGQADATTTVLSIPVMQGMMGDCSIDNDKPTVIVATQNVFDDFYALVQPQQRFQDSETAKAGFTNMLFNGVPVIVDSHQTSGDMMFLNENYLKLVVHKDEDFRFEPFLRVTNQAVTSAKIFWAGNLVCNNPRMQGWFSAIA